ncbi:uncharacterized protein LOC125769390 [Anopheles funestus]|uniref:uncharacterized protein LOC125769390 n=1 Tax=Anopheles funestus TaxID=62324 RepID=UPI0020C66C13|nr:uncharacterized protein LOC125769390 [Anopheles funestus]
MSRDLNQAALRFTSAWANFIRIHTASLQQFPSSRVWMRPMLLERENQASRLVETILKEDLDTTIINFMRLSRSDFNYLLERIGPKITKMDTNMRKSLSPKDKLIVTLRYLATGDSYKTLEYAFRISAQAIGAFIPEVCDCLVEVLQDYVKLPSSPEEWMKVVQGFEHKWNFPHTLGAMDGKHVATKAPPHSGTDYYNYKHFFSLALLGVVDADCNFMYADVGAKGRISDGGVFRNTSLYRKLERNDCNIPSPAPLHETSRVEVPYMFLGDKAFPLTSYCLRPFGGFTQVGSVERNFNQRHSIARRTVEMAFGILSARFRVLKKPMELQVENAKKVIMATIYLHNFIRRTEEVRMHDSNFLSGNDEGNANMRNMISNASRASTNMLQIRMHVANFLMNN